MTRSNAITVQTVSLALAAQLEAVIAQKYDALSKKLVTALIAADSPAILVPIATMEFSAIENQTIEQLARVLPAIYDQAFNRTIALETAKAGIKLQGSFYSEQWTSDGRTFRDRTIINNQSALDELGTMLFSELETPVKLGLITDIVTKAKNKFLRLIRTEAEAAYAQGNLAACRALGYLYLVIENPDPCDAICVDEVGERLISIAEARVGLDLPPYHPNCKCIFRGIYPGQF